MGESLSEALERIINLALYLDGVREPVTAEQVREKVIGYRDKDQDDAAFARMFERDKDDLRRAGIKLDFDEQLQEYSLDRKATFSARVDLSAEEAAVVRTAGTAVLGDPSFPFADDLRLALAKIAAELPADAPVARMRIADEDPARQGRTVAQLVSAGDARKVSTFDYTNSMGVSAPHTVEPYGLFTYDGRWYLVGRDTEKDETRTYAAARIENLKVNAAAPKTPDFERPDGFDVSRFISLPFEYGPRSDAFEAVLRFEPSATWRAAAVTLSHGSLEPDGDALLWRVNARSEEALLKFVIEHGPGVRIVEPQHLIARMRAGLEGTVAANG